jgi:hypothetical protein
VAPVFFIFKLLNATAGGVVDTSIYQYCKHYWKRSSATKGTNYLLIPAAKLWTDIKIEGRLQGDLVKT